MGITQAPRHIPWAATLGVGAVGAYCVLLFSAMNTDGYDTWGALVIGPLLLIVSWPIIAAIGRSTPDPWLPRLLWTALVFKLVAGVGRYFVAFALYDGNADSRRYDQMGKQIVDGLYHGIFHAPTQGFTGTGFVMVLTGVVYLLIGPSLIGGFLAFSWLGFWGLYFIYRAFRIAVPEGDHRRYARLLFFLPSMLFWPSSIGKEAWMVLTIGLAALGAARLFTHQRFAYVALAAGLTGTAMVRPHVTLMLFAGIFFGYLLRPSSGRSLLAPIWKIVGVLLLIGTGLLLVTQASTFLGVEGGLNDGAINQQLQRAGERTDEGGSSFQAAPVSSPSDLPQAALTVLFRPFPWEAGNAQALVTAAEGSFLLALICLSMGRLRHLPSFAIKRPFVMMCLPYIVLFVIGFATFGNFGILARQRVQVYPFVLVLVCLPVRGFDRTESRPRVRQRPYSYPQSLQEGSSAR